MPKKREEGKEEKSILRGLSSYHVDGVCEGVHASHVLVNIDSYSDSLRSAWLKYIARSVIPCYADVLLPNQRDPVANGEGSVRCNGRSQVTGIEILLLSGMSVTSGQRYRGKSYAPTPNKSSQPTNSTKQKSSKNGM